jgi:Tol biopolymer transport system component
MVIAFLLPILIVVLGFVFSKVRSLRLKVWMFNLAAIASILFHAEVIFTMVYADKDIPNLYELHGKYYFNKPYLDQQFNDPEFVTRYKTNIQGYRVDDLSSQDQKIEKCDWLFIGDSYTQGAQVDYNQLFSSLIYKDFPDKVIVNAGISGAGLYDELNYFKDKGKDLSPKLVFLQIGAFNDFMNIKEHVPSLQDYIMEWSALYRYFEYNIANSDELLLGRWTEPFFPDKEDNVDNNIFFMQTSDYKEADKKAFKDCISEFKKEVESVGGKLILVFIPSKEQVSPELLEEVLKAYNINKEDIDLTVPNKLCQSVASELGLKLYDLTTDFCQSKTFPFFAHDEHMNIVGHQLIADRIVKELSSISGKYDYLSEGNYHERYPTIHADGTMVYQSQTEHYYTINRLNINNGNREELWRGVNELVHPMISSDDRYLVFTEGEQESLNTDVILYDFVNQSQIVINKKPSKGSIPFIGKSATKIVFPCWTLEQTIPHIVIYDIATGKQTQFEDGAECWRPVFSNDERYIYYIQKGTRDSNFVIKKYDLTTGERSIVLKRPYDIWDIAVSPSGKYIAYAGNKDANWDLFTYDIDHKQIRQITHTIGEEWDPAFGVSDDELWFAGVFGINDGIYHIRLK